MFTKNFRALTCVLLVCALLLGVGGNAIAMSVNAAAVSYVSLGDDLTAGDSYAGQAASKLNVQHTQLAVSGQGIAELAELVANDETYRNAIANANIISIASHSGNFASYVMGNIEKALEAYAKGDSLEEVLGSLSISMDSYVLTLGSQIEDEMVATMMELGVDEDTALLITDATVYSVASAMYHYSEVYNAISELNSDATLIQVPMLHGDAGLTLDVDGLSINMDEVLASAVDSMNTYLITLPTLVKTSDPTYISGEVLWAEPKSDVQVVDGVPTAAGHKVLADAVVWAFNTGYTVRDKLADENAGSFIAYTGTYYVAIGDCTAMSDSYVDLLAELLGAEYTNLAQDGSIVDAVSVVEANADTIAKADLITIGYGSTDMATAAMDLMIQALIYNQTMEFDWDGLLGDGASGYVDQFLADVHAGLVEEGLDETVTGGGATLADAMTLAVESFAYSAVEYLLYLPQVIDAVRQINPNATIDIIGMSNPFNDASFVREGKVINVEGYLADLIDLMNVLGASFATMYEDVTYVAAPEADNGFSSKNQPDSAYVENGSWKLSAAFCVMYIKPDTGLNFEITAAGDAYILQQIIAIANPGRWGDVNWDGWVDAEDAALIMQYEVGLIADSELNLNVADVNADGWIDAEDAALIMQYEVGIIDSVPADQK